MLALIIGIELLQKSQPLLSIHENNPVLQPLIDGFMSGVLDRLGELSSAIASDDLAATKRVAHQFKGSASTYGFPQLAKSIGRLEERLLMRNALASQKNAIVDRFNLLVGECACITSHGIRIGFDQSRYLLFAQ